MPPALFLALETCDPSDSVCALKHSEFNFVDELLLGKIRLTQVVINGRVPCTTNTTPSGFDEQWFQKEGLKGELVVSDQQSAAAKKKV